MKIGGGGKGEEGENEEGSREERNGTNCVFPSGDEQCLVNFSMSKGEKLCQKCSKSSLFCCGEREKGENVCKLL